MSQRSSRNPLTLTFPAKPPHSPDEMRMRQMKLGLLHFLLALLFSIVIAEQILFYYQLLIAGIFDKLFISLFIIGSHHQQSFSHPSFSSPPHPFLYCFLTSAN